MQPPDPVVAKCFIVWQRVWCLTFSHIIESTCSLLRPLTAFDTRRSSLFVILKNRTSQASCNNERREMREMFISLALIQGVAFLVLCREWPREIIGDKISLSLSLTLSLLSLARYKSRDACVISPIAPPFGNSTISSGP